MALPITAGSDSLDSQAHTQSPQSSAGSGSVSTAPSGSIQPGTAASVLTSDQGVRLNSTQLSVVSISTAPQTITGQTHIKASTSKSHHINPVLLGMAGAFLLLAVVFFVITARSAKKKY